MGGLKGGGNILGAAAVAGVEYLHSKVAVAKRTNLAKRTGALGRINVLGVTRRTC